VWGGSFLFIKVLVDAGVDPPGVSAGRCLFGVVALLPFAWTARRQFPRTRRTIAGLALLGLVNMSIPWTLFPIGEQHVTSGIASIDNSTAPLWTAVFAAILIGAEPLGRGQIAGLLLGFAGVVVLVGDDLTSLDGGALVGTVALLGATLCYGMSAVSIRRWLRHVPAVPLTITQLGFASLSLLPVAIAGGAFDGATMGGKQWASLAMLGAAGSGFAGLAYMWLIGQVGAVRAAVVTYLLPPIAVVLGWLFLDESIGWNLLAALVLVAGGIALVQRVPVFRMVARAARMSAEPAPIGE
jgi:drug/metabolite transporter (DMT)-like permease